ncbi:MarR family transcriptional regulator, partial [Agrobacterium sp. S2]|nr:MarR family transcriptional regulator [Agrobacterium sp. S2]
MTCGGTPEPSTPSGRRSASSATSPALVFEALEHGRARSITALVEAVGCSRSSIAEAVDLLCEHGLVERTTDGLLPHPELL